MKFTALLAALVLASSMANAARGPIIPCPQCDTFPEPAMPETGWWYNPSEPGTGFNIEVQNGYVLGAYYGYDASGAGIWYLFQGDLKRAKSHAYLTLEADLQAYREGTCLTCAYQQPNAAQGPGAIMLKFFQRNHASFSVAGGEEQFIIPLVFGTELAYDFGGVDYPFPDLEGYWTFVVKSPEARLGESWSRKAEVVQIHTKGFLADGSTHYTLFTYPNLPEVLGVGTITCRLPTPDASPECSIEYATVYPGSGWPELRRFNLPLANIGDSRIEAVDSEGFLLKGLRLDYD